MSMIPKKLHPLNEKFAGIDPARKVTKVGKKKVGAVRRTVAKIIKKVTDK